MKGGTLLCGSNAMMVGPLFSSSREGLGSIGWLVVSRRNGSQRKPNPSHLTIRDSQGGGSGNGCTAGLGSSSFRIAISDCCCQFTGIGVIMASASTRPLPRRRPQHLQRGSFCRSSRAVTSNTPQIGLIRLQTRIGRYSDRLTKHISLPKPNESQDGPFIAQWNNTQENRCKRF